MLKAKILLEISVFILAKDFVHQGRCVANAHL